MSDDADRAQPDIERELEARIRAAARPLRPGEAGECEMCGEWSGRLIAAACAPCRDRYDLVP